VAGKLAALREKLERIIERFQRGERRGLVLALISALRLRERGEPITPASVAREGREIIRRTKGRIDWGVDEEGFTEAYVTSLLEELVELGVLEPEPSILEELDKKYRFRSYESEEDARAEALRAAAPILLRAV
jgi:hypothetical protein